MLQLTFLIFNQGQDFPLRLTLWFDLPSYNHENINHALMSQANIVGEMY